MKNLFTILLLMVFAFNTNAQESKVYIGLGVGYAGIGGDADETLKGGISLNLFNFGLRFNETFGITANLASSGHVSEDSDDVGFGLATFSVGPMMTIPLGNMSWDFKPQISLKTKGVFTIDGDAIDELESTGKGFVIGNSINFGSGEKGFGLSIDIDYVSATWTDIGGIDLGDDGGNFNSFRVGAGVRYNF
tara:strand:+ start:2037 stop:2609 length:573 start_codon:yes stop_codon:yes gene_type:complete